MLKIYKCTTKGKKDFWPTLKPRLPRAFRKKVGDRPLAILVHPLFSNTAFFHPSDRNSKEKNFEPQFDQKDYNAHLEKVEKHLVSLPAFAVMDEAGEQNEAAIKAWLKTLPLKAKVLWIETAKSDPLPMLPVPYQEIASRISSILGGRAEKFWESLKMGGHVDEADNFHPTVDARLHPDDPDYYITAAEEESLSSVFRQACFERFAWLLRQNGIFEVELFGELAHWKREAEKTFRYGCVPALAEELTPFIRTGINNGLIFPGFNYVEAVPARKEGEPLVIKG